MKQAAEGKALLEISAEERISKDLEVFYNPVMKLNRDVSIALLKAVKKKELIIADILAGTGVRSIRFLKELPKNTIRHILINDIQPGKIEQHLAINKLQEDPRIVVTHTDANKALRAMRPPHYIDIDPYGSPNPFLDNALQRILPGGIVAVTATDTAPLAGTYPKACRRKYWAEPLRNEFMHEVALRILARKVQLVAAQYEKAAIPIVSYWHQHYYRLFFRMERGKSKADALLKQHQYFLHCQECFRNTYAHEKETCCNKPMQWAGPLFIGNLQELPLLKKMKSEDEGVMSLLYLLREEYAIDAPGFFDIHAMCRRWKIKSIPKFSEIMEKIGKKAGVARVHTNPYGLKTTLSEKEMKRILA